MRASWLWTIVLSLALAAAAAMYANKMLNERMQAVEAVKVELFPVVAAATDIPAGMRVEPVNVKVIRVPADAKPEGGYTEPSELIGQVAKQTVYAGEIITANRFANSPGASALAAIIPEGKRAITVAVNTVVGVSGFILPGSRVDILAAEGGQTRTILQNIKVLAVGQMLNQDNNEPVNVSAVTLEVDPQQAEIIAKAGNLRMTLRNPEDGLLVADTGQTEETASRSSNEPSPQPQVAAEALYVIDIVRGTAVSSQTMDW
jgi:pilus assembly protein CpaB